MASVAAWTTFHYAVRAKGALSPTGNQTIKWIIQPEIPPIPEIPAVPDDPGTPEDESTPGVPGVPGVPEIARYFRPIQHYALTVSAGRAGITIY